MGDGEQPGGTQAPATVVIADDHAVVRGGVRTTLERAPDRFTVLAEAADVRGMVQEVQLHKPDLLIMDLTMPGGSSLSGLASCFEARPDLAVTVLTMHEDPGYARQAIGAGARSYVLKEAEPAELLHAVRVALAGGRYVHPRVGAALAAQGLIDAAGGLSEREREVVRLVALGHTNAQIAEQLHVAERTVKTYRARAVEKTGAGTRAELTAYARRHGLLEEDD